MKVFLFIPLPMDIINELVGFFPPHHPFLAACRVGSCEGKPHIRLHEIKVMNKDLMLSLFGVKILSESSELQTNSTEANQSASYSESNYEQNSNQ